MHPSAPLRDLKKLNTFVRVAERRSFTKAAADLRTTPSVISKHMKELEDSLGFSLLSRSTHGILLTDAGEGLLQNCLRMLSTLDDYVVEARNLQSGPFGTLRVQTTGDHAGSILATLAAEFAGRHPGLRVHLSVLADDGVCVEDGFDVIVASKKPPLPGLEDCDLGEVRHVVCASPEYFQSAGRPSEPKDLREHNCLANLYSGPKSWPFQSGSRQIHVEVKGSLSSNSGAALIQMAREGRGIVRAPRRLVGEDLSNKTLESIFDKSALSPERLRVFFAKAKHQPVKTTEFVRFLLEAISAR